MPQVRAREPVPKKFRRGTPCTDHTGRPFRSIPEMCRAWNVNPNTYANRIASGKTLEEALAPASAGPKPCTDHLGNEYPSERAMFDAYGVTRQVYRSRMKCGYTKEQALTAPRKPNGPKPENRKDPDGTDYRSVKAMCAAHGITHATYKRRLRKGYTKEEALSMPVDSVVPITCKDYAGRNFPSASEMCRFLGLHAHRATDPRIRDAGPCLIAACCHDWADADCGRYSKITPVSFPWFMCTAEKCRIIVHFEKLLAELHSQTV